MKLSEIRERIEEVRSQPTKGKVEDGDIRRTSLPRMPYNELPRSLQEEARERASLEAIREFVVSCYPDHGFDKMVNEYLEKTYCQKEGETQEALYKRLDKAVDRLLIRARNLSVFTVGYSIHLEGGTEQITLLPELWAVDFMEAFEKLLSDKSVIPDKQSVSLVYHGKPITRQRIISSKALSHALTPMVNENAYIAKMTDLLKDNIDSNSIDININNINGEIISSKYDDIKDIDITLLNQIFTILENNNKDASNSVSRTITVSLPALAKDIDVKYSEKEGRDLIRKLEQFIDYVGVIPDRNIVARVLVPLAYDTKNNIVELAVPYPSMILEMARKESLVETQNLVYHNPAFNWLCHSSIAKERNKMAVYLVYEVTNKLLQLGDGNGKKPVRYTVSFKNLIRSIPELGGRIDNQKHTANKNNILSRAFTKFYELLESKTDATQYFTNLKTKKTIPTMSTLDDILIVTHMGINKQFKSST